jgi:hypothetical protein
MTLQVFDKDGKLLDSPSITAIIHVRQFCRMWKKINLECSSERNRAAINGYIKCEQDLESMILDPNSSDSRRFSIVSGILWSNVLSKVHNSILDQTLVPKHGPGVVADRISNNSKYIWRRWHQRLEHLFPVSKFAYHNEIGYLECSDVLSLLNPDQEQPVRVVFVPKTVKTPRVIAVEPACNQYIQQALSTKLCSLIERDRLTGGHVNFTDQSVNAKLALESSKSGNFATLDLSEASDRVHNSVVKLLLSSAPLVLEAVQSCRSTSAKLPDGTLRSLSKFASMGSALCFPIEAMVFYTICVERIIRKLNLPLSAKSVAYASNLVFVYGDDLIVPKDMVESVITGLEAFGLKVNHCKSFWTGKFRESCGVEAYDGVDVTTSYFRRVLPNSRRDVRSIISAVELGNQLHNKWFFKTATLLFDIARKFGDIPSVPNDAHCFGIHDDNFHRDHCRFNGNLQRLEVKTFVFKPKKVPDIIDSYPALMKWFLSSANSAADNDRYIRSVGRGTLAVKRQWCGL